MSSFNNNKPIKLARFLVVSLVACAGVLLADSPARADGVFTWGRFLNVNSGQCMGVLGGVVSAGKPIVQWPCNGSSDQTWGWIDNGSDPNSWGNIYNFQNPTVCLSLANDSEGAQLVVAACTNNDLWLPSMLDFTSAPTYVLYAGSDNYVAAVSEGPGTNNGQNDGTGVISWVDQVQGNPGLHPEQQWIFPY